MSNEEKVELMLCLDRIKIHLDAIHRILNEANGIVGFKTFEEAYVDVAAKKAVGYYETMDSLERLKVR